MAQSSSRNRWIACCSCSSVAVLVVALSTIPLFLTSREHLSVIGKKVADSSRWDQSYDGYYWESNDAQMVTINVRTGPTLRLDDRTGRTSLAVPISMQSGGIASMNQGARPSPDGNWLLFQPRGAPTFTAVNTATHQSVQWKASPKSFTYALWFADSRRWVEFAGMGSGSRTQPIVHSVDAPDRKTTPINDSFVWPVGVAPTTHVLNARNLDHLELWEYDLDADRVMPMKHRIALPSGSGVQEVEGSPDGSRVAYLVHERRVSFLTRLFGGLFPIPGASTATVSLWVSRTDGSDLRRIGLETAKSASGVQWSPDGKRLSFFMDNGFYIVPVR